MRGSLCFCNIPGYDSDWFSCSCGDCCLGYRIYGHDDSRHIKCHRTVNSAPAIVTETMVIFRTNLKKGGIEHVTFCFSIVLSEIKPISSIHNYYRLLFLLMCIGSLYPKPNDPRSGCSLRCHLIRPRGYKT